MRASTIRYVLQVGAVAAVYFAAAKLGLELATVGAQVTLVWPPTGIALTTLLLGGPRLWPGVLIGATLVNASTGVSVATACGMGIGNTLEALVAALLLRRVGFQPPLARLRDVLALVTLAAGLSTIASASIGVASLALGGTLHVNAVGTAWGTWWLGDALGDIVVAPIVLVGMARPWRALGWRRGTEAVVLLVAVVLASLSVFGGWVGAANTYFSLVYLVFPFALWATLRFGPPGAVVFTAVLSSIGIWGAVHATGPFAQGATLTNHLLNTQVFMGVVAITTLILAAAVGEREQAAARVQALNVELEQRVSERTAQLAERQQVAAERALLLTREQAARRAAELAVARMTRLQAVTGVLATALTPAQVAEVIIVQGGGALEATGGSVALLSDGGTTLSTLQSTGYPEEAFEAWRTFPVTAAVPMADAVRANEVLLLESGEEYTARYRLPAPWGAGGLVALPLIVGDRVIGGMELRFPSQRPLDAEDHAFLRTLADLCAQALDRAGLYEAERQAHAQAAAAVQARDEFLAIAAHELKTPVTSLRGFAQLLLRLRHGEHHIDAPPVRLALQHIDEQSHKLHALVVQLLDLSRIEAGRLSLEKADVDLVELVESVVTAAQAQASTHVLVVDAPRPAHARVDPVRIEQVLVNLVHNAIKFSPNGGPIDLSVRQSEGTVQVAIRDHGLGIPPEHRARLFDRFYQAHAQSHRSGMGLGLHISRHIVELHGGSITPGFPADGGVCFVVALPTGHDQTPTPA